VTHASKGEGIKLSKTPGFKRKILRGDYAEEENWSFRNRRKKENRRMVSGGRKGWQKKPTREKKKNRL